MTIRIRFTRILQITQKTIKAVAVAPKAQKLSCKRTSAEVSCDGFTEETSALPCFVGFRARKHEIELEVHRVLECA